MLHSQVYNEGLTKDIMDAFRNRDDAFFINEVKRLGFEISKDDSIDGTYLELTSRMYICLALLDVLKNGGNSVSLIMDFINF